jgi:hypothetical protein
MRNRRFYALTISAALSACATMAIITEHDPNAPLQAMRTYHWAQEHPLGVDDPRIDTARVHRAIRDAIDTVLQDGGYEPRTTNPDFVVDYHAVVEHRMVEALARIHPGDETELVSVGPEEEYGREYDEGSLIVDFLDPETKRVVWRGLARDEVNWRLTPDEIDERIRKAVQKILSRFPPP